MGLASACGLLILRTGDESGDRFSAVKTEDKAATAAALCEPGPAPPLGAMTDFGVEDELNAEFKAAKAEAL